MIDILNLEKKLSPDFSIKIGRLHIDDGERVAVIGPNGSGKSTLLKILAGLIKPDSGTVDIGASPEKTGYEPQNPYIFSGSVEYNIKLGVHGKADIDSLLSDCELAHLRAKRASTLSGGEKQRMCLARMLAGNYSLLLLDEPLSAADIETSAQLEKLLLTECEKNGTTLLMSTHLPRQALTLATKILIMNHGTVSEYSDSKELTNPESEFGKRFIEQWRL